MVWLEVCSRDVSPLGIFETGTLDHHRYIKRVLIVALKLGNDIFGRQIPMQNLKNGVPNSFPALIDKGQWSPNSPDLNPIDYSLEFQKYLQCMCKANFMKAKRELM